MTTRRGYMLAGFAKMALWVLGVTLLADWILPVDFVPASARQISMLTIGGGILFGVGATVNGGCAFSTLTRLGGGNVGMVASLAGFLVGAGAHGVVTAVGLTPALVETTAALSTVGPWRGLLTTVLSLWMVWELIRLCRSANPENWRQRLFPEQYRLLTAAVLMGLSHAVIYALIGLWPYTQLFGQVARRAMVGTPPRPSALWFLFAALIIGIGLSAWQGRRFILQWRPDPKWAAYGAGGVLMGLGAAMIPGAATTSSSSTASRLFQPTPYRRFWRCSSGSPRP